MTCEKVGFCRKVMGQSGETEGWFFPEGCKEGLGVNGEVI